MTVNESQDEKKKLVKFGWVMVWNQGKEKPRNLFRNRGLLCFILSDLFSPDCVGKGDQSERGKKD
jgi:hypothetical protein